MLKPHWRELSIFAAFCLMITAQEISMFNTSICTNIKRDEYHYYINANSDSKNIFKAYDQGI